MLAHIEENTSYGEHRARSLSCKQWKESEDFQLNALKFAFFDKTPFYTLLRKFYFPK